MKLTKAALLVENAQLRQLNAEWAAESKRLKLALLKAKGEGVARAPNTVPVSDAGASLADRARRYCAEHGVKSVSLAELENYA